jgi:hypothetical protein
VSFFQKMDYGSLLWAGLDPADRLLASGRFLQLSRDEIAGLGDQEFCLFAQWLYGRNREDAAQGVAVGDGFADFAYPAPNGKQDLLRVYVAARVPVAMIDDVLQAGQGRHRVSVYMRAKKGAASARLAQEFPLAFEVVDIDGLADRVEDARRLPPSPDRAVRAARRDRLGGRAASSVTPVHPRHNWRGWTGAVVALLIVLSVLLLGIAVLLSR